ncbi:MAG: hypothetical protein OEY38_10925 [Gammaproteobacteria bacterium]|nr:hypothetical protein [Gammaproteobacteria bacterium]
MLRFIVLFLLLSGCSHSPLKTIPVDDSALEPVAVLLFHLRLADGYEGNSRVIVSDNFMRIDEGEGSEDYILFDRKQQIISNIVADDQTIFQLSGKPKPNNHSKIKWAVSIEKSHALIRSAQSQQLAAKHIELKLNGQPCYNLVAIENFLSDVVIAMRDYRRVLAQQNQSVMPLADDSDLCTSAIQITDPDMSTAYGFPYREWGVNGYQRFLQTYHRQVIDPKWFQRPAGYTVYGM